MLLVKMIVNSCIKLNVASHLGKYFINLYHYSINALTSHPCASPINKNSSKSKTTHLTPK